ALAALADGVGRRVAEVGVARVAEPARGDVRHDVERGARSDGLDVGRGQDRARGARLLLGLLDAGIGLAVGLAAVAAGRRRARGDVAVAEAALLPTLDGEGAGEQGVCGVELVDLG